MFRFIFICEIWKILNISCPFGIGINRYDSKVCERVIEEWDWSVRHPSSECLERIERRTPAPIRYTRCLFRFVVNSLTPLSLSYTHTRTGHTILPHSFVRQNISFFVLCLSLSSPLFDSVGIDATCDALISIYLNIIISNTVISVDQFVASDRSHDVCGVCLRISSVEYGLLLLFNLIFPFINDSRAPASHCKT